MSVYNMAFCSDLPTEITMPLVFRGKKENKGQFKRLFICLNKCMSAADLSPSAHNFVTCLPHTAQCFLFFHTLPSVDLLLFFRLFLPVFICFFRLSLPPPPCQGTHSIKYCSFFFAPHGCTIHFMCIVHQSFLPLLHGCLSMKSVSWCLWGLQW